MTSVDHRHNREGSGYQSIETAIQLLLKEAKQQTKGRTLVPQLPDLLATAIEEVLERTGLDGRENFETGIVDSEFLKRLEKQFTRVQDRYYKRRQRRPAEGVLLTSPISTPSEPAVELEQREMHAALQRAVEELPDDLKAVIRFHLERMRSDSLAPTSEELQKALGFGESSYRLRLRLALSKLRLRLKHNEAL